MWRYHASVEDKRFYRLPLLNVKVVHNSKTKSAVIILTPWTMFLPISAFLSFLVSEVARGE